MVDEASQSKNLASIARFGIFCNTQHVQLENKVENPTSSNLRQEDGVNFKKSGESVYYINTIYCTINITECELLKGGNYDFENIPKIF